MPADLAGACKFCALFARSLWGGQLQANWFHSWLELDGAVVDLTGAAGVSAAQAAGYQGTLFFRPWHVFRGPYVPDSTIAGSADHDRSLLACQERVDSWLAAFPRPS